MGSSNTGRLLIEGAIRLLKGLNYTASSAELGSGFTGLNDLIASWSVDKILVPAIVTENFTLTVGQGSYTIGSSGNFNTVRPTKILEGVLIRDSGNNDHPIDLITRQHYKGFIKKDNEARPAQLYYEPFYPLGILYFDSEPTSAEDIYFDSLKTITEITDLSTALNLPPEYKRALRYNLAVEIAPEFPDVKLSEVVVAMAIESKNALERVNDEPIEPVTFDSILLPTKNYHSGTFNSG